MVACPKLLSHETRRFAREYELCQLIGKGSFGEVWICRDRWSGEQLAAKLIDKSTLRTSGEREDVLREIAILEALAGKHEGVVHVKEVLEGESVLQIVMELCRGGDLFELLKSRGCLPEEGAKVLFRQLASALAFCHANGVVHRDIKPENILLDVPASSLYDIRTANDLVPPVKGKLADFGLAVVVGPDGLACGYTGSRYYTAPEMLKGLKYGRCADVWSLGVVLCTMLTGRLPFAGQNKQDIEGLRAAILRGKINFDQPAWHPVSESAKQLVRRMLTLDPEQRISAEEALGHPWLAHSIQQLGLADDADLRLPGLVSTSLPSSPIDTVGASLACQRQYASMGPGSAQHLSEMCLPGAAVDALQPLQPPIPQSAVPQPALASPESRGKGEGSSSAKDSPLVEDETPEPVCCVSPMALTDLAIAGVWCFPQIVVPGWGQCSGFGGGQQQQGHGAGEEEQKGGALRLGEPHTCIAPLQEFFAF